MHAYVQAPRPTTSPSPTPPPLPGPSPVMSLDEFKKLCNAPPLQANPSLLAPYRCVWRCASLHFDCKYCFFKAVFVHDQRSTPMHASAPMQLRSMHLRCPACMYTPMHMMSPCRFRPLDVSRTPPRPGLLLAIDAEFVALAAPPLVAGSETDMRQAR